MSRFRAAFTLLLAFAWFSAAWHADLETLGWMLEHEHHVPHAGHTKEEPAANFDGHEPVLVRGVAKELKAPLAAGTPLQALALPAPGVDPVPSLTLAHRVFPTLPGAAWAFAVRCAPLAAAPPRLA